MIRFTILFVSGLLIIALVVSACIKRIAPDEIGIHIMNTGGGLDKNDYDAGFYRSIWLLETWDTLPRSVQKVSFTNRPDLRGPDDAPAIEAKTADGDRVTVEATVLFRIAPGKGHLVYERVGRGDAFKRLARDLAKPPIVTAFAKLNTQYIYGAASRRATYNDMRDRSLREGLATNGLELVEVSIMEVTYDPKYEAQLERLKVATQKTLLEKSQQSLVKEEGEKKKIIQETDNIVQQLKTELLNTKKTRKAENDLAVAKIDAEWTRTVATKEAGWKQYRGEKEAQGTQAKKEAEAVAVQLQKDAYGENGANVVAYQAAINFPVRNVTMPSFGIDWFSPLAIAQRLGGVLETVGAPKVPDNH